MFTFFTVRKSSPATQYTLWCSGMHSPFPLCALCPQAATETCYSSRLQNCCSRPSGQWHFQHHKLVTFLPQLKLWPLWIISLSSPSFPCYFGLVYFERGKKPNTVTPAHQGISFSLPVLFRLIFPDAGVQGVHLVSLAISSFIDCIWAQRYLLTLWSNPNTFLPDEMCDQTNSLSQFPCRGTYSWLGHL